MSGIKYEVLAGDDLISALRGGRTGDLLDDAAYAAADEIERLRAERDALRTAAGKVTCRRCSGSGVVFVVKYIDVTGEYRFREPCPACADLKQLLGQPCAAVDPARIGFV